MGQKFRAFIITVVTMLVITPAAYAAQIGGNTGLGILLPNTPKNITYQPSAHYGQAGMFTSYIHTGFFATSNLVNSFVGILNLVGDLILLLDMLIAGLVMFIVNEAFTNNILTGMLSTLAIMLKDMMSLFVNPQLMDVITLVIASWAMWYGLVKREVTKTFGGIASSILIMALGMFFMTNTSAVINTVNGVSNAVVGIVESAIIQGFSVAEPAIGKKVAASSPTIESGNVAMYINNAVWDIFVYGTWQLGETGVASNKFFSAGYYKSSSMNVTPSEAKYYKTLQGSFWSYVPWVSGAITITSEPNVVQGHSWYDYLLAAVPGSNYSNALANTLSASCKEINQAIGTPPPSPAGISSGLHSRYIHTPPPPGGGSTCTNESLVHGRHAFTEYVFSFGGALVYHILVPLLALVAFVIFAFVVVDLAWRSIIAEAVAIMLIMFSMPTFLLAMAMPGRGLRDVGMWAKRLVGALIEKGLYEIHLMLTLLLVSIVMQTASGSNIFGAYFDVIFITVASGIFRHFLTSKIIGYGSSAHALADHAGDGAKGASGASLLAGMAGSGAAATMFSRRAGQAVKAGQHGRRVVNIGKNWFANKQEEAEAKAAQKSTMDAHQQDVANKARSGGTGTVISLRDAQAVQAKHARGATMSQQEYDQYLQTHIGTVAMYAANGRRVNMDNKADYNTQMNGEDMARIAAAMSEKDATAFTATGEAIDGRIASLSTQRGALIQQAYAANQSGNLAEEQRVQKQLAGVDRQLGAQRLARMRVQEIMRLRENPDERNKIIADADRARAAGVSSRATQRAKMSGTSHGMTLRTIEVQRNAAGHRFQNAMADMRKAPADATLAAANVDRLIEQARTQRGLSNTEAGVARKITTHHRLQTIKDMK